MSKIDLNFNILDSVNVGMDDTNHSRYIHAVTFCKPTSTRLFFPASIITKYFVPTSLLYFNIIFQIKLDSKEAPSC